MPRYTREPQRDEHRQTVRVPPVLGLNAAKAVEELAPGETPSSRNVLVQDKTLQMRSGLSVADSFIMGAPVLGGGTVIDLDGRPYAFAFSHQTAAFLPPGRSWTTLEIGDTALSGSTLDDWQMAPVIDPAINTTVLATNNRQKPKQIKLTTLAPVVSDFTYSADQIVTARAVGYAQNRILWWNVSDTGGSSRPTRLVWSQRGGFSHDLSLGAGFQDLLDMRGIGTTLATIEDQIVLFSTKEVWIGRPRTDFYVFDFHRLSREVGCPHPQTVKETPFGVVFLGHDSDVYVVAGNTIRSLGIRQDQNESRIQSFLQTNLTLGHFAWADYDSDNKRYHLYYTDSNASGYPTRALYYDFEVDTWFEQQFSHELAFGHSGPDPTLSSEVDTWDAAEGTWDDDSGTWDQILDIKDSPANRQYAWSSAGTVYRFLSNQTTDAGTAIDCRWRTGGLRQGDSWNKEELLGTYLTYSAPSASSLSVFATHDQGVSFGEGVELSLQSTRFDVQFASVNTESFAPATEIRWNDGGRPKIAALEVSLRDAGIHSLSR